MRRGFAGCGSRARNNHAHALAASGADKKQSSADLLTKKQHTASETQRDLAALKKSKKSNIAAEATSSTDGKFCARDIATKTDTAAREGCYEKSCTLEANGAANEKRGSADLLAKEQYGASETQRDFAALEKSEKSDFAAKATNDADEKYNTRDFAAEAESGADAKFCAHTLIASEKFFTRDFAVKDTDEKPRATNLSAQGASGNFA